MRTIKWLATSAFCGALLFTACKKDETTAVQTEQFVASEDQTTADNLYQDVDDQVDEAIETRGGGDPTSVCPVITITPDDGSYPRTMTIDYGTDGCPGPGGRTRKGQVVVVLSDTLIQPGATRTVNFVDFYIDDAKIEGTRTLLNEGFDANGNIKLNRTVTNGKITFPNGEYATWEAAHIVQQVEGGNTPNVVLDNVFEITGGSSGVNRHGKSFQVTITEPLVKKRGCFWIVEGVKTLTVETKTATIDYGDGTCDNKAEVTLPNGTTKEITIKRWW
jgi:hypothetical protein